jgi:glyoxylase I family protein
MEKVLGIGGVFFRSNDPGMLARWYEEHLGVSSNPADSDQPPWVQETGPTVFAPFPDNTDYFGDRNRAWMVNFRVADLDAMVSQLRRDGIEVVVDPEPYPHGRFARLYDPEGNAIELWQPEGGNPTARSE